MKPCLNLMYTHSPWMGYGRLGTEVAKQLVKQNVEVFDHLGGTEHADAPNLNLMKLGRSEHLNRGTHSGRANVICWLTVPPHGAGWWKGQKSVIFTMWEAMRLPESFRDALDNYDTIIVPSMDNVELFSKYHDNVKYVPLGVDPEVWHYQPRQEPGRFFNFLIGGSGARKGTDLAVKAFTKLWGKDGSWGSGPVPILQMKNPKAEDYYRGDGRIQMISGGITAEEEVGLYAGAHCYLQPSRGEGFGLQPLQAIAQGCPTILTDGHGHRAFSHLGRGIDWTPSPSSYFIYGDAGDWWEPNFDDLCQQMEWVYNNYAAATSDAKWASGEALAEFTWERTANGLLDAIGRDRLTPYDGPDEWREPDVKLYPIVTTTKGVWDIGCIKYHFEPGTEYWCFADVKRVLFEAGLLDPCCLHDDDPKNCGLDPRQVEAIGGYQAQHGACPTCGRALNGEPDEFS